MFAPKNVIDHKDATCTEEGWVKYGCTYESNNNAAYPEHTEQWTETIGALGHDFTVKQSETPATCERAGTIVWKCSRCDETKTETIPALNHDYRDDWQVTTPATCTDPGVETRYCHNDHSHSETRPTAKDSNNHAGHGTRIEGYVAPPAPKTAIPATLIAPAATRKSKTARSSPPPATTGRTTATAPTPAPSAVPPRASLSTPTAPLSCGWWTLRAWTSPLP